MYIESCKIIIFESQLFYNYLIGCQAYDVQLHHVTSDFKQVVKMIKLVVQTHVR